MKFYRSGFNLFWITLNSDSILGILDTSYVEDYYGVNGQITLKNIDTNDEFAVIMTEDTMDEPFRHSEFNGSISIGSVPNGHYEVRGRVRDTAGNYTILNSFQTPSGGESVNLLTFVIKPGFGIVLTSTGLYVILGIDLELKPIQTDFDLTNNYFPVVLNLQSQEAL